MSGPKRCISIQKPTIPFNGLMFCGEAPGAQEEEEGKPFVGPSGKIFEGWLKLAGIKRHHSCVTNVFHIRPENNKIDHFFVTASMAREQGLIFNADIPEYNGQRVFRPYDLEIDRLCKEIKQIKPSIIVSLGAVALWSLTGKDRIGPHFGRLMPLDLVEGTLALVLPLYHPMYLQYSQNKVLEMEIVQHLRSARRMSIERMNAK